MLGLDMPCFRLWGIADPLPPAPAQTEQDCHPDIFSISDFVVAPKLTLANKNNRVATNA
jgi:hypothetical protein